MKLGGLLLASLFCLAAQADKEVYELVKIDWNKENLEESVVLQCDDSYASGVDIDLPGEFKFPDIYMSYEDCGVDWRQTSKKVMTDDKTGAVSTRVRFEGGSSCTIKVLERVKAPAKPKKFTLDISDAC